MKTEKLIEHSCFAELKPYLRVSKWRINVASGISDKLLKRVLKAKVLCARCKKPINAIRIDRNGLIYTAGTCPQTESILCSRSGIARAERAKLRYFILHK